MHFFDFLFAQYLLKSYFLVSIPLFRALLWESKKSSTFAPDFETNNN